MAYIWQYIKQYPKWLFLNFFGAILSSFVLLGLPTLLAQIIDGPIITGDSQQLWFYIGIMVVLVILGFIGNIILIYASSKITNQVTKDIRLDAYEKINKFSHKEFEDFGVSSLVNRITNDAFVLLQFMEIVLRVGFDAPLIFVGSIILIIITSPTLSWTLAVAFPFIIAIIWYLAKKSGPISDAMQFYLDKLNTYSRENITGLRVVRAFAREEYQEDKFETVNEDYRKEAEKLFKLMGGAMPIFFGVIMIVVVLILSSSIPLIGSGNLQIGTLVAIVEYAFHTLFSVLVFSQIFIMYPRANVSSKRLKAIMDKEITIESKPDAITKTDQHGYLEFDQVSFAYPGETENPVLHDISFEAKPGQVIAFIGSTGSGKSTLVQLIPRFFDVTFGKISIDGVDVRDFDLDALRSKIGFISQKALLFTGTIDENLRYGKEEATDEELWHATDIAQAKDFIEKMEEQYTSYLSEGGSNLSGGQKQRLSIARAIVKKPEIYVFDDSFSALDYKTDAIVRERLKEITGDSTVIIVAQRISSIRNADQIIVLEEGEIRGRGTHEELMETNEIYQAIAMSQIKNSEEDA